MSDNAKRAHDLALTVVSESLSRDFDNASNGKTPEQRREALAASVLDEYNFFYDAFLASMK